MFLCNVLCSEKGFCFQTGCSAKSKSKTCPSVTIRRLWRVTTNINSQMESSAKLHPSIDNSLHEAPTGEGLLQWGLSAEKSHILQSCSSFVHLLFIFVQPFNRPRPSIIYISDHKMPQHMSPLHFVFCLEMSFPQTPKSISPSPLSLLLPALRHLSTNTLLTCIRSKWELSGLDILFWNHHQNVRSLDLYLANSGFESSKHHTISDEETSVCVPWQVEHPFQIQRMKVRQKFNHKGVNCAESLRRWSGHKLLWGQHSDTQLQQLFS